jgi:glycosyltransferase involved in cell wall biosynthesis
MRILITTDTIGGVWTFTRELTTGLLEAGCEIVLVSFGPSPNVQQQQWADDMQRHWRSHFHFVANNAPLEWMQSNGSAYTQPARSLLHLIQALQIDVLHCNQFCFGALPIDQPKVITAHSDVLSWARACRADKLDDSDWLSRYRALIGNGLAGAQAIVAPTRWMLEALNKSFDLPGDCRVIANGRSISPASQKLRKLQAITAGRLWDEAKNIALLGEVSSPIPLLVAGDSSCDGAGAPSALGIVRMLGPLAEDDLLTMFQESELYICTSRYEPFGLAPLEAALCGCAILANDIPSLREVWQDGALYFNDAASLSELLHQLHGDRKQLAKEKARSLVQAQVYSREQMTSSYLTLFRQVLARDNEVAYVA